MIRNLTLVAGAAALLATPAAAHLAPGEHGSLAAGLSHPLFGLDHVLAMVAVGLWAGQTGGRALWATPLAFVSAMVVGYALALAGLTVPMAEPMILASVIALGLLAASAAKMPVSVVVGAAAVFGVFHGAAHGAEVGTASALVFGLGFVASTALLHAAGIALARVTGGLALRGLGAGTALAGVALAFA